MPLSLFHIEWGEGGSVIHSVREWWRVKGTQWMHSHINELFVKVMLPLMIMTRTTMMTVLAMMTMGTMMMIFLRMMVKTTMMMFRKLCGSFVRHAPSGDRSVSSSSCHHRRHHHQHHHHNQNHQKHVIFIIIIIQMIFTYVMRTSASSFSPLSALFRWHHCHLVITSIVIIFIRVTSHLVIITGDLLT